MGKDVFISLPTGYGKSLCFALLPYIFDTIRGVENKSIVMVVSPLIALMKDQVATFAAKGKRRKSGGIHQSRGIVLYTGVA